MSTRRMITPRGLLAAVGLCLFAGCAAPIAGPPTQVQLDRMLKEYTGLTYHFFPERDHAHRYLVTVRLPSGRSYLLTEYSCMWTSTGETWQLRERILVFDADHRYVTAYVLGDGPLRIEPPGESPGEPPGPEAGRVPLPPDRQAGAPIAMGR